MWHRHGLVIALVALALGCTYTRRPITIAIPNDGSTAVVFENHLPEGFRVTNLRLVLDGDPIAAATEPARSSGVITTQETASLFRSRIPEGAHTLQLVCEVRVPCGLTAEPYEKLTATIARSFEVGPTGGLVHIDAFAQSAWLNPAERVHVLVSLRGLREGRWLYGQSKDAQEACGRLGRLERSRCVVQRLADRARSQHDVAGLLCQKDKLETIDEAIASLDDKDAKRTERSPDAKAPEPAAEVRRDAVEARVQQLEHEAEYCVGEDLSWMGEQQVTSDRSACARYDEPLPY